MKRSAAVLLVAAASSTLPASAPPGNDRIIADALDAVASDCESVTRSAK
jgi:hypothetical protein